MTLRVAPFKNSVSMASSRDTAFPLASVQRGTSDQADPGRLAYTTRFGRMYEGFAENVLASPGLRRYRQRVQMVFTSPPFPLNTKKRYGNLQGDAYVDWLAAFAPLLADYLTPNGSIVVEVGNAWVPGSPVMSPLTLRALLAFLDRAGLHLCQQFIANNPARLPGPAQWTNVERIRVKDSYTHVWWMSPTERPKADNRRVLGAYSKSMLSLLKSKRYNSGTRPSQHRIGVKSFLTNNTGSIPSNVLTASNTRSSEPYLSHCRANGLAPHEARMPSALPEFFVQFLTDPGDWVLDPFGGSNTTGAASESLKRHWLSIEPNPEYIAGSRGRFASVADPK
jgi:DNA modification methylase